LHPVNGEKPGSDVIGCGDTHRRHQPHKEIEVDARTTEKTTHEFDGPNGPRSALAPSRRDEQSQVGLKRGQEPGFWLEEARRTKPKMRKLCRECRGCGRSAGLTRGSPANEAKDAQIRRLAEAPGF
jgi:hypothetical protein